MRYSRLRPDAVYIAMATGAISAVVTAFTIGNVLSIPVGASAPAPPNARFPTYFKVPYPNDYSCGASGGIEYHAGYIPVNEASNDCVGRFCLYQYKYPGDVNQGADICINEVPFAGR